MNQSILKYQHIRDLREDSDLTQAGLAKVLNCSQVAYSYYEIGKRDIPTEVLISLADYYDCSVDYLLGRTDDRFSLVSLNSSDRELIETYHSLSKKSKKQLLAYIDMLLNSDK